MSADPSATDISTGGVPRSHHSDATVPAKKPRYATAALFYSYPATLIAEVLCVTRQTAYHFKSGIRRPGPTSMRLWHLYVSGRILGDEWDGWQARDGALFDPEGHRTTQPMLRAYAFVWQLARELAKGDVIATEALDQYSFMATARMNRERKRREADARSASTAPLLKKATRRANGTTGEVPSATPSRRT